MPKVGEKQSVLRNSASKIKKGFRRTQKQEVAQKRRKETRAVEVTFVGENDVVSEKISPQNLLANGKYSQTTMKAPRMKLLKMIWRLPRDADLSQWTVFLNMRREFTHKLHVI